MFFFRITAAGDVMYGALAIGGIAAVVVFPIAARVFRRRLESVMEADLSSAQKIAFGTPNFEAYVYQESEMSEEPRANGEMPDCTQAWHEVLGVLPNATAQEIDAAWREKMKRNHPDRVAELDKEFQTLAEQRAKNLNAARSEGLGRLG